VTDLMMDLRWAGLHGIGRYASELAQRLPSVRALPVSGDPAAPLDPLRTARALRRHRPDVFFTPGFNAPLRSPVPFVFCLHDLIHVRFPAESSAAKTAYYRWIVRPAGFRAHRVLTDSEFSRRSILEWSGWPSDRVAVVSLGVGPVFRPQGPRHDAGRPYLLHVGNAKPHKNRARLVAAFAASRLAPRLQLVLLGPSQPDEVALARQLGVGESVVHAGDVPDAELPDFYRGAAAVVCPSLYEGFGLPALEAMACGTAVAAARATSLPEVAGDAAAYFDPLDVADIARVLVEVVTNEDVRRRLASDGIRRAAAFSWDTAAGRVREILEDAALSGGR